MMKQFTCVVCPNGCEITVENVNGDLQVTGEGCARGRAWAFQETTDPRRTIATSVRVLGGAEPLCSARLTNPIPRKDIMRAVEKIHALVLHAPVEAGSVLIADILGTGSDVVATRSVAEAPREQNLSGT